MVPRAFLGPVAIALPSAPLVGLLSALDAPKLAALYVVCGVFALMSTRALIQVRLDPPSLTMLRQPSRSIFSLSSTRVDPYHPL